MNDFSAGLLEALTDETGNWNMIGVSPDFSDYTINVMLVGNQDDALSIDKARAVVDSFLSTRMAPDPFTVEIHRLPGNSDFGPQPSYDGGR